MHQSIAYEAVVWITMFCNNKFSIKSPYGRSLYFGLRFWPVTINTEIINNTYQSPISHGKCMKNLSSVILICFVHFGAFSSQYSHVLCIVENYVFWSPNDQHFSNPITACNF